MVYDQPDKVSARFLEYIYSGDVYCKDHCPASCVFQPLAKTPMVGIPEPNGHKFIGVLVSEDPTVDFIGRYLDARSGGKEDADGWRRPLFEKGSPPAWLIERLREIDRKHWDSGRACQIDRLNEAIQNNFYWTHMLKCCTMKNRKLAKIPAEERITAAFTHHRGMVCADTWLNDELSWAINQGASYVIALGISPEAWLKKWKQEAPESRRVTVINLPHPSPINRRSWNPKTSDRLGKELERLFELNLKEI